VPEDLPPRQPQSRSWLERGRHVQVGDLRIFTVDVPAARDVGREPLVVLHGFPTSSFDFHLVVDDLARLRRVLLIDMPGFGFSSKPDVPYHVESTADVLQEVLAQLLDLGDSADEARVPSLALLTHDMGDTVGGELLARQAEGRWNVEITRRVVTNGSIYIDMAHLTDGQLLLLSLPDERLARSIDVSGATMKEALRATFSQASVVDDEELDAAWDMISHEAGDTLLPRLIRYIEDRRRNESRYTGAIVEHPSPLGIVWGSEDPIAVEAMASRLHAERPDSSLNVLVGVGHYPMLESPAAFAEAVVTTLDG
jgi:pimeloyl-ACP methyl ester carboxylesterase